MPKTLVNVKDDILMVTRKLLSEEGYGRLNMRTIASNCGIATGTLYNYYKSKQEIVEEILKIEWNMMLRRIEQASKSNRNVIENLGIIYSELIVLMNDVHKIWFADTRLNNDYELSSIKGQKEMLLKSLTDKIFDLISDNDPKKDCRLFSDAICKLLIIYAYEGNTQYDKLSALISALLK
ncbi:MAG TPA: TetR/AcrR family transcriptional regulator [Clostridia bacterium]|nr:TetR/AcrR family transcriptional regulator [Clostridia bacterium]